MLSSSSAPTGCSCAANAKPRFTEGLGRWPGFPMAAKQWTGGESRRRPKLGGRKRHSGEEGLARRSEPYGRLPTHALAWLTYRVAMPPSYPHPESWASSDATRRSMQGNRGRDTGPELALRSALHALGLRYRVNTAPLPDLRRRRADVVFPTERVAVFVDGCFWHGCPEHGTSPRSNRDYWSDKIASNRARDRDTDRRLDEAGWQSVRVWEHEEVHVASERVAEVVRRRRARHLS